MISLDQVYLLEQKVESAVEKIQQLQAENDALRNKCTELTNALSAKSEQLSSFESDQSQIETGIKKALDRLNSIENSVLKTAEKINQGDQAAPNFNTMAEVQAEKTVEPAKPVETEKAVEIETQNVPVQDFESENQIEMEEDPADTEEDNHDGLGFDIF